MPPVGFEPMISAGERPQTYTLDRAVTGTGQCRYLTEFKISPVVKKVQKYKNKWIEHVRQMDRDRQTDTFNYEISTYFFLPTPTTG